MSKVEVDSEMSAEQIRELMKGYRFAQACEAAVWIVFSLCFAAIAIKGCAL